jgi:hypothetical protein
MREKVMAEVEGLGYAQEQAEKAHNCKWAAGPTSTSILRGNEAANVTGELNHDGSCDVD